MKISEKLKIGLEIAGGIILVGAVGVISFNRGRQSVSKSNDQIAELIRENQELKVENSLFERELNKLSKIVNNLTYQLGKKTAKEEFKI